MINRRIIQIGVSLLMAAGLGAGAALADAPANDSGASSAVESHQAISVDMHSSNDSMSVSVDHHTDQGVDNNDSQRPQGPENGLSASTSSTDNSALMSGDIAANTTTLSSQQSSTTGSASSANTMVAAAQQAPVYQQIAHPSSAIQQMKRSSLIAQITDDPPSAIPVPMTPVSQKPNAPTEPLGGLLQGIRTLMSDVFAPTAVGLSHSAQLLYSILPTTTLLVAGLTLIVLSLGRSVHWYAARLRASGFLGAPRSHVIALQLFATPLKWVVSAGVRPT